MNETTEKRFAVLIDSDNVSPKYIKSILEEITSYGTITYKRIYGDWTSKKKEKWKNACLENSIMPMQQYEYTQGKNATDSYMIIDAMDILYSGNIEGFCIVSSDSDFTRLAARLRESGMTVIGMGENKTPKAFITSCNEFKKLENLLDEDIETGDTEKVDMALIEDTINKIISERDADDDSIYASELRAFLIKRYADFDVKDYGYSKFSLFLDSMDSLELFDKGRQVRLKESRITIEEAREIVRELVKRENNKINITKLDLKLKHDYPQININSLGYSKLKKFLTDIEGLKINSRNDITFS